MALNKPSNLSVHAGTKTKTNLIRTLKSLNHYKNSYLELAHRLDKDTSGCIIIAKNKNFLINFQKLLLKKLVKKEYHALVKGNTTTTFNTQLDQNILNNYNKKIKKNKKITETYYKTIKQYKKAYSLIKIFPKTGKLHQIRIHLAHIGHPIAQDIKYGNKNFNEETYKLQLKRLFLHAKSINFTCPITNKIFNIKAKYEITLKNIIKEIKR